MPPFPAQDLERDHNDLQILTHRLYQVMNERRSEEFRGLWLDGEEVLFHAGDGNITKGGAAVSDLFRQVRIDEHYVDPGRRGIMLHPTVEISDVRVIVNGLHAWVSENTSCIREGRSAWTCTPAVLDLPYLTSRGLCPDCMVLRAVPLGFSGYKSC